MLTYSFADLNGESMYTHLYKCIKKDILARTLHAGEKLPSKRTLAKNLGVSLITVENAYAQLQVEGYIYSLPKRGYYVEKVEQKPASEPRENPAVLPQLPQKPVYYADLTSSNVPEDTFPYNIWAKLLRRTLTTVDEHSLLEDNSAGGVLPLRRAIAKHLYGFRGMDVAPEQIIIGAGTQILYNLLVQLLGREKTYALEDPGYPQLAAIYGANNISCRYLAMDKEGISAKTVEASGAQILHLSPSHQFPTGIVMPISRRCELLDWAGRDTGRYIIEDDYDCEFRLYGRPIPSLQSIDKEEKVIYTNTFSKTLAPTFRISYLILPPHLAALFYEKLGFYAGTVSNFEQFTLAKFIDGGYFERHLNRMRTYYRNKRDEVLKYLAECSAASALEVEGEDSGLHFLLHLATDAADSELAGAAAKQGIRVKFLSAYFHAKKSDASHTLLMNYTGLANDHLYPALDRLFTAIGPYLKT